MGRFRIANHKITLRAPAPQPSCYQQHQAVAQEHRVAWQLVALLATDWPLREQVLAAQSLAPWTKRDKIYLLRNVAAREELTALLTRVPPEIERSGRIGRPSKFSLPDDKVLEIKQRYALGGVTQTALAAEFGVGVHTIKRALKQ